MRCPACEQRIDDKSSYCVFCGKVFDAKRAEADDEARMQRAAAASAKLAGATAAPGAAAPARKAVGRGRDLDAGNVLSEVLEVWVANLVPFTVISAMMMVPVAAFVVGAPFLILASPLRDSGVSVFLGIALGGLVVTLVFQQTATGALTYGVVQHLRSRPVTIGDCLARGLSTMLPAIGTAVTVGFSIILGLLACIIPGLMTASTYALAVPVAVIEKRGVSGSMERSSQMTDGNRWPVFFVLLGVYVLNEIADRGTHFLMIGVNGTFDSKSGMPYVAPLVGGLLELVLLSVSTGLSATAASVLYYRLRGFREPTTDIHKIASVFD